MKWMNIEEKSLGNIPHLFTAEPHTRCSDRYDLIRTIDAVEKFIDIGWKPVLAAGKFNNPYGFHAVKFENPKFTTSVGGDVIQMIMSNSHDGTRPFKIEAGLYRLVCSNGLRIKNADYGTLAQRHVGVNTDEFQFMLTQLANHAERINSVVGDMQSIIMSPDEQIYFAESALACRLTPEQITTVDIDEFLSPLRSEDSLPNLWCTFNVIQEKMVNGLFTYKTQTKRGVAIRKARKLNHFIRDLELNEQLFDVAAAIMTQYK